MSFNRPQFLKPVLESLKNQRYGLMDGREVHLFQDGAINRYSRIRYAFEKDIHASVAMFRDYFPDGVVHEVKDNIGICENFRRAENYIFQERDCKLAYFLEDDLVLSPVYLQMMDRLSEWAVTMPNVAYFAAYGDYYCVRNDAQPRSRDLVTMDHHWAFGLFKKHWLQMQPLLADFYGIVCGHDYTRRDNRKIFSLYEHCEASPRASSQDAAKAFACDRLGLWRANTVTQYAKYIGRFGQHMTPAAFDEIGFDRTVVAVDAEHNLNFPDVSAIDERLAQQHALFADVFAKELPTIISQLPPPVYNPMRGCTAEDLNFGVRLFLNTDPAVFSKHTESLDKSVYEFVLGLVESDAFKLVKSHNAPFQACSREDVIYAYRLCLHREPESAAIFDEHVGKTDAGVLTRAIWRGEERQNIWNDIVPFKAP